MVNLPHLHLLLNHWPIIGAFIATGLFVVALAARSEDLKQVTLALFALIALLSVPAFVTGHIAEDILKMEGGVSDALIATHQGAALFAFAALLLTGGFAWTALWQYRRSKPSAWLMQAVLVGGFVTVGLMTITGSTGGAIRHPEILAGEEATSFIGGWGATVNDAIVFVVTGSNRWIWPVLEVFHFVGLALLLGATGVLNLRLLGFYKHLPAGPFHRFIPWGLAGMAINIVTGMLFFLGMPFFYIYNADFLLKVLAIVLAGASLLLHSTSFFRHTEYLEAGQDASGPAKLLAASSLALWIAVIVFGRYMPLFEDSLDPRYSAIFQ